MLPIVTSIFIAFFCGALASRIAGRSNNFLGALIIGFIGSNIGQFLAASTNIELPMTFVLQGQKVFLLWNIIGAASLLILQNLIFGPPKNKK